MSSELTQSVENELQTEEKIRILELLTKEKGIYLEFYSLEELVEEMAKKIVLSNGISLYDTLDDYFFCLITNDSDLESGFYIGGYSSIEGDMKYVKLDIQQIVNNPNFNFTEFFDNIEKLVLNIISKTKTAACDLQTAMGIVSRDTLVGFKGFIRGIRTVFSLPPLNIYNVKRK